MIGKYMLGKSFRGCLLYCLHDKQTQNGQVVVKDRADVLLYNQCFGSDKELIRQFQEVRLLNRKVAKPVLHITLSLAPGEQLDRKCLSEMAEVCAKELGFAANQYIAVMHCDTDHKHLHIVANRIGLNGRAVSDSNSYGKMATFCRKMEQKYNLQQVLSPKRYLAKEQRQLPRLDDRKLRLKENITQALSTACSYTQFEEALKAKGCQISKGRGITFWDEKGVKVKGSEMGLSLSQIERVLNESGAMQQKENRVQASTLQRGQKEPQDLQKGKEQASKGEELLNINDKNNKMSNAIELLLRSEKERPCVSPEWLKKKRKRQDHRPRL
jgi:hypothetical protein